MARDAHNADQPRLEGLVLFDGAEYYELPYVVIERYRVPDERRDELRADAAPRAGSSLPWLVYSGTYAPVQ